MLDLKLIYTVYMLYIKQVALEVKNLFCHLNDFFYSQRKVMMFVKGFILLYTPLM